MGTRKLVQPKTNLEISKERINQLEQLLKDLGLHEHEPEFNEEEHLNRISILNEALTHTSAKAPINHERLEFLGDAVLRLAASEFIDRNFPDMNVGKRSALRAQLVSDRWLAQVGQKIKINKILLVGPNAAGDNSAKATLDAEATEALIGALYEYFNDLKPIHIWLTPHWHETSETVFKDPHWLNSKSALQEWCQGEGFNRPNYRCEEISMKHGDPMRFFCKVSLDEKTLGNGWGGSRREAEQHAARNALKRLKCYSGNNKTRKN